MNRISYQNGPLLAHNWQERSVHNLQESPVTSGKRVSRKAPPANVNPNTSMRTVILGIDKSGTIVQHDRTAPTILARPGDLLGVHLSDITSEAHGAHGGGEAVGSVAHLNGSGGGRHSADKDKDPVAPLLDAVKNDKEASSMLTITTAEGITTEAVVSIRPMRGAGETGLAALVTLQIPAPITEPFVDPSVMRQMLLHDTFQGIESTLDFADLAARLMDKLVPHFCTAGDLLVLESLVGDDEFPTHGPDGNWQAAFPPGEILRYPPGSPYVQCIESGRPVLQPVLSAEYAKRLSRDWKRKPVAKLLSGVSMLILPLITRQTTLGFFVCTRAQSFRRFDPYDMEIGSEFAARAATLLDGARQYNREHATALTLQRSMLPRDLSAPSSVEVKHRYLPGSELVEVGGDWYESICLPGGRVALVIGDVAGHGVRAAVTMGRLRTAIQTLAMLELPPAESLQQLHELMQLMLGTSEPHFATCTYAGQRRAPAPAAGQPGRVKRADQRHHALASARRGHHDGRVGIRDAALPDPRRQPARALHRRAGGEPGQGHPGRVRLAAGDVWPRHPRAAARGPVQGVPARGLRGAPARRHRRAHRPAAAHPRGQPDAVAPGGRGDLRTGGPRGDPRAHEALGPGRLHPGNGAAGLRAGDQRRAVRQERLRRGR